MTAKFNSKETYLQYRKMWKERYAALSQTIRDLKWCRKLANQGTERYNAIRKQHETQWGFSPQGLAWHYRQEATAQLLELKMAKEEAQRQYLASRGLQPANQ